MELIEWILQDENMDKAIKSTNITTVDKKVNEDVASVIKTALLNPYVLALVFISAWNAVNDPTTVGIKDSKRALGYTELNK